ncbi:MAG: hypothetical protein HQL68_11420, partial [Magnetococcales bacterium]|nr:hypothetical protein [Magnetococcales bacterium]
TEDGKRYKVWNDPPSAKSEERLGQLEEQTHQDRCIRLALWAQRSIEAGSVHEDLTIIEGLEEARTLDYEELFSSPASLSDFVGLNQKSAVVGAAYVVARYEDSSTWNKTTATWCLDVLKRAVTTPADVDSTSYRGSILSMHPLVFAVHGFGALLLRNYEVRQCQISILDLAVDPLEGVVEAVASSAKLYAPTFPDFFWILYCLLVTTCITEKDATPDYHRPYWDELEAARNLAFLDHSNNALDSGIPQILPDIPMPWIKGPAHPTSPGQETHDYVRNTVLFDWGLAEKAILTVDLEILHKNPEWRTQFLKLIGQLVDMTIQEIIPPFAGSRRDHDNNTPYEWVFSFFNWLGKAASRLSLKEVESTILKPLFTADNETALLAMQSFAPSYLAHAILMPKTFTEEAYATWNTIANWILDNKEGEHFHRGYVNRDFASCSITLFFCFGGYPLPLACDIDEGWPELHRFSSLIERAVRKFGTNLTLFLGVLTLFKRGGLDLFPDPALSWLTSIVKDRQQDRDFWRSHGHETVELLKLILEKKAQYLNATHRDEISLISDILVDNGVRGAGFFQQELLRT